MFRYATLASESFEDKFTKGLGIIPNKVNKFTFKETKSKFLMLVLIKFFLEEEINYSKDFHQEQIFLFIHIEFYLKK